MPGRYSFSITRKAQDLRNARSLVGKRLSVLMHDQYYFNEQKDLDTVGDMEWRFGDGEVMSMYLLSDGDSVGADLLPTDTPASFELEPGAICCWKRENVLASLSASRLEGEKIREVEGILDSFMGQEAGLVGFRIVFESGDFMVFLNQGDNAVLLVNKFPPACVDIETRYVTELP